MNPEKKKNVFKKGIWIKEQQGVLTMGSLDRNNKDIMVISDDLSSKLQAIESDMLEALYGESSNAFQPGILDMEILFNKIKNHFKGIDLKISFKNPENTVFKCEFNPVFSLLKKIIQSSTSQDRRPAVYINASIVQDHLCIIYRDSDSISDPSDLGSDFFLLKNKLNGSIQFKKIENNKTYYDIMIPSNS